MGGIGLDYRRIEVFEFYFLNNGNNRGFVGNKNYEIRFLERLIW